MVDKERSINVPAICRKPTVDAVLPHSFSTVHCVGLAGPGARLLPLLPSIPSHWHRADRACASSSHTLRIVPDKSVVPWNTIHCCLVLLHCSPISCPVLFAHSLQRAHYWLAQGAAPMHAIMCARAGRPCEHVTLSFGTAPHCFDRLSILYGHGKMASSMLVQTECKGENAFWGAFASRV